MGHRATHIPGDGRGSEIAAATARKTGHPADYAREGGRATFTVVRDAPQEYPKHTESAALMEHATADVINRGDRVTQDMRADRNHPIAATKGATA